MFRGYHSLSNAGTAYTPQWMKMPNLASSNHAGTRYCLSESQVGSNFDPGCTFGGSDAAQTAAANINTNPIVYPIREFIRRSSKNAFPSPDPMPKTPSVYHIPPLLKIPSYPR